MPDPVTGTIAAVTVGSSLIGSSASRSAAASQERAAAQASDAQRAMFERQVELQEPFRRAGLAGQNRLMELLGLSAPSVFQTSANQMLTGGALPQGYSLTDPNPMQARTAVQPKDGFQFAYSPTGDRIEVPITSGAAAPETTARPSDFGKYATAEFTPEMFKTDPGYAFRMSEGMKALERSAAARGNLLSGATLKGAQRYGQDLASQEFQNAFNRYQITRANTLNPYQALSGSAQTSANVLGGQAGELGRQLGSNIIGGGNAAAAGQIGSANAIVGGVGQGINFYQNQQLMNRLYPARGGGGGGGFRTTGEDFNMMAEPGYSNLY